jgi:hypothetical protein
MKTFTLDEAQSLLPVLEALLKRALDAKLVADQSDSWLTNLARRIYLSGGMKVDVSAVAKQRAEMDAHLQIARESLSEIDSIGVQVKDLDTGLLDFPCRLDDEVVLLCWRMSPPSSTGTLRKPASRAASPSTRASIAVPPPAAVPISSLNACSCTITGKARTQWSFFIRSETWFSERMFLHHLPCPILSPFFWRKGGNPRTCIRPISQSFQSCFQKYSVPPSPL